MDPNGMVPGFKRLLAHFSQSGSRMPVYCEAHSLVRLRFMIFLPKKVAAIWEISVPVPYTPGRRAALDFAFATGQVPVNGVTPGNHGAGESIFGQKNKSSRC